MPVAKITGQGLFAIGCAVALLWTCLFAERAMMRRAWAERAEVMRTVVESQRQRNTHPAFDAMPFPHRQRRITG